MVHLTSVGRELHSWAQLLLVLLYLPLQLPQLGLNLMPEEREQIESLELKELYFTSEASEYTVTGGVYAHLW